MKGLSLKDIPLELEKTGPHSIPAFFLLALGHQSQLCTMCRSHLEDGQACQAPEARSLAGLPEAEGHREFWSQESLLGTRGLFLLNNF